MQTSKNKKMSWLFAVAALAMLGTTWLAPEGYFQEASENDFIQSLKQKLTDYDKHLPEDRLYLQTDKPLYEPGDDIWLSAWVRDGISLKASTKSDIVYVELINPKGTVEKKINLIAKNGKAAGDFALDKEVLGGLYKLRAYTNWMKNQSEGEENQNYFEKEIQVQNVVLPTLKMKLDFDRKAFGAGDEVVAKVELSTNENKALSECKFKFVVNLSGQKILEQADLTDMDGLKYIKFNLPKKLNSNDGLLNVMIDYNGSTESISRSIPIVLNKITFTAYPEGGDLVYGMDSKVAFKVLNEFGKGADVEGVVYSEKNSKIISFSSYHQGMGAFSFNPQVGERYFVKITKPIGIEEKFSLPEPLERGYVLNVNTTQKGDVGVDLNTTEVEEVALVAQTRGKIYYSTVIKTIPGNNKISFSTQNFPIGVSQITLFDSKGIARAERLVFVNKHKQMNISVETEKEKYLPREKVKMTISVKDERGLPMPANLCMAVVNDQFLSFADDKTGNILSQLLLQQDIKGKIEEPAFYFNQKEKKADKALDYLLMTSGWRRFTWEKLLEEELPTIKFPSQKAVVAGTVYDGQSGKPIGGVKIKKANVEEYACDENGKFSISKLELFQPVKLTFETEGYSSYTEHVSDYSNNMSVHLYNSNYHRSYYNRAMEAIPEMAMQAAPINDRDFDLAEIAAEVKSIKFKHIQRELARNENRQEAKKMREELAIQDAEVVVEDLRFNNFGAKPIRVANAIVRDIEGTKYYRARQYSSPAYEKQETVETRTDFRNTIYWNSNIEIGYSGKKTIEFFTSDDITSFRATIEGIGFDGMLGRTEKNFFTQLPFAMTTKIPVEVVSEDLLSIPLTLKNNTSGPLGGIISIEAPEGLKKLREISMVQTIMPGKAKTIFLDYKVLNKIGYGEFTIGFKACGLSDAFTQKIKIAPKGFPVQVSFAGQEVEKEYTFEINKMVNRSLKASFTAFPNVVSDLMKGVEGILQEPYGCFEQTSCMAYPNAMVLDYLKNTDSKDNKTLARATDLLDRGYKRLTTFETSTKGYEWFGANPAHEGLTAYGIMEFVDMKRAGQDVDMTMLDRTARWVLNHKDGKGGFERERRALHDFGRISDDVLNAYIVYALAEAGYTEVKNEFEASFNKAKSLKDPYLLAMMSNAAFSLKENSKGNEALNLLLSLQDKEGSFNGSTHSITYSQGASLTIETTALSIMAILKSANKDMRALNQAVAFLTSTRSGSGVFSSTQGTILSLKALTEFAKFSKRTNESGTIVIYIDNKKVAEKEYKAGDKGAINIEGLEQFIKEEGKHSIKIKYVGVKTPLPYSIALNWNTYLPNSDKECVIDLKTKLTSKSVFVGETVRLIATIANKSDKDVPSTMAIVGIPAGFTAQPWQLKELQEKGVFDYYEIKGNSIAIYYRGMGAKTVKEINLDLKAEMPGEYDAPASSAYLYYTNEFKTWSGLERVTIQKTSNL